MIAILYLAAYIFCGLCMVRSLLPRKSVLTRIWLGASLGLLLMMWLPALMAFAVKFSVTGHLLALIPLALLTGGTVLLRDKAPAKPWDDRETRLGLQMLLVALPLTLLSAYLQFTHNVRIMDDGSWWVGQATYGDLAMHMSFVTSLKNAAFPPDYSLFPGMQLSYPFLTDSLSTTFYLFGWPLQAALAVPGTLMMALCYMGVMCLARDMTAGRRTAVLAALLFFLNGGLGFLYDFDLAGGTEYDGTMSWWSRIEAILDGYYMTPTNQPTPNNLRWSNVIADLMLPQRTLLGGWCMVIPCFYLLFTTFRPGKPQSGRLRPVILLGVWGGALPLIHTHSFVALALCSLGLLVYDGFHSGEPETAAAGEMPRWRKLLLWAAAGCQGVLAAVLLALHLMSTAGVSWWLPAAFGLLAVLTAAVASGWRPLDGLSVGRGFWLELRWYLLYGGIACVLSVPQLFGFTFRQVFQEGMEQAQNTFIQPWFNWVNSSDGTFSGMIDGYGWFYVKNIGLPFIILILALFERNPRWRRIFAGALPIILAAECIRFQPNIYDNNKLLYLAWLLCCLIVADWCRRLWQKLRGLRARPVIAGLAAVTFFLSAGLTLWREAVSEYMAFSADSVAAGVYARDNTEEDATFLTGVHHLNPVASIAGRDIVCGPDLWLYYHGIDTTERKADISRFYLDPANHLDVLEKYSVDYILVSSYERTDYTGVPYAFSAWDYSARAVYAQCRQWIFDYGLSDEEEIMASFPELTAEDERLLAKLRARRQQALHETLDGLFTRVFENPEATIWKVGD
ncbi:MAG: hypothetical protein IJB81_10150 [Clostridia bacterium]|nr:hypothetical protein [Clostridia bacterium]